MISNRKETFKREISTQAIMPFIGVYDVFSASIAAKYYNNIFLSGFGFAASFYGLPDIGFITWSDMVSYLQRVRAVLPYHYILVDMDDGYGDASVASHVTALLDSAGASGAVLEDQRRPRRCGHFDGKELLTVSEYIDKLTRVLNNRGNMFIIARTDASDPEDIFTRAVAYAQAGADAVLADGIGDLKLIKELKQYLKVPIVFNQINGGKSPIFSLDELKEVGISMVIYSTPCLFPAQAAIEKAIFSLKRNSGLIQNEDESQVDLKTCDSHLKENQLGRNRIAQ